MGAESEWMTIPPLVSGGVMLSYQCSSECRHCLYRCSPRQPGDWMTLEMAGRIFDALAEEHRLRSIHIGGGEPFLRVGVLEEVIRLAARKRVRIDYVETNASWAKDIDKARATLEQLRAAGLSALLVSVSMFHNEYIPFECTRNCVEAAADVFGPESVIAYLPQLYERLLQTSGGTHTLEEFCQMCGLPPHSRRLQDMYDLIPGGRVPEGLREYYDSYLADHFSGDTCRDVLLTVTHFHIDQHGDLFTGCSAGLAPATVDDLHPPITEASHPVFWRLCEKGPHGLMEMAAARYGFKPRETGYISKCDLCFDVRRHLQATGEYPELRPAGFYQG